MKFILATKNHGKIRELHRLIQIPEIELVGLPDTIKEVDETGATFAENARLKAAGYALQTGMRTIADDSGLEVDALGGAPGIHSARYGGTSLSYDKKIEMLLTEIKSSGDRNRAARFVSHIAVADERGVIVFEAEGICTGVIAAEPKGTNGFGYDPIFIPDGLEQTFGELPDDVKQNISHRAAAISKIIRYLRDFA
ncbi:MAG: RdgB/HAM1 family non-canonical purine NTP pyrophosphatase [Pyrinomonadaceae bacterium]